MELNSTWSPHGAHSTESWLTQGSGATPSTREASYELQTQVANPSPAWLRLCPNSKRDRRSCPSWNFLSGTHSQASTVTLFLPKRQSHVSIAQTNVITQYTFSVHDNPSGFLVLFPRMTDTHFQMRREAPSPTAPTSLSSIPPFP